MQDIKDSKKKSSLLPAPKSALQKFKNTSSDAGAIHSDGDGVPVSREIHGQGKPVSGDRVIVQGGSGPRHGTLRYFGKVQFAEGLWCGVELDTLDGNHNGTVNKVKYFSCDAKRGVFVVSQKVQIMSDNAGKCSDGISKVTRLPMFKTKSKTADLMDTSVGKSSSLTKLQVLKHADQAGIEYAASRSQSNVTTDGNGKNIPSKNLNMVVREEGHYGDNDEFTKESLTCRQPNKFIVPTRNYLCSSTDDDGTVPCADLINILNDIQGTQSCGEENKVDASSKSSNTSSDESSRVSLSSSSKSKIENPRSNVSIASRTKNVPDKEKGTTSIPSSKMSKLAKPDGRTSATKRSGEASNLDKSTKSGKRIDIKKPEIRNKSSLALKLVPDAANTRSDKLRSADKSHSFGPEKEISLGPRRMNLTFVKPAEGDESSNSSPVLQSPLPDLVAPSAFYSKIPRLDSSSGTLAEGEFLAASQSSLASSLGILNDSDMYDYNMFNAEFPVSSRTEDGNMDEPFSDEYNKEDRACSLVCGSTEIGRSGSTHEMDEAEFNQSELSTDVTKVIDHTLRADNDICAKDTIEATKNNLEFLESTKEAAIDKIKANSRSMLVEGMYAVDTGSCNPDAMCCDNDDAGGEPDCMLSAGSEADCMLMANLRAGSHHRKSDRPVSMLSSCSTDAGIVADFGSGLLLQPQRGGFDLDSEDAGDEDLNQRPLSLISTSSVDTGYQQENDFDTVRTLTLNTPLDEFSSGIVTLSTHDVISLSAVTIQELTHSLEKNSCRDVNPMTDPGVNHRINSDNGGSGESEMVSSTDEQLGGTGSADSPAIGLGVIDENSEVTSPTNYSVFESKMQVAELDENDPMESRMTAEGSELQGMDLQLGLDSTTNHESGESSSDQSTYRISMMETDCSNTVGQNTYRIGSMKSECSDFHESQVKLALNPSELTNFNTTQHLEETVDVKISNGHVARKQPTKNEDKTPTNVSDKQSSLSKKIDKMPRKKMELPLGEADGAKRTVAKSMLSTRRASAAAVEKSEPPSSKKAGSSLTRMAEKLKRNESFSTPTKQTSRTSNGGPVAARASVDLGSSFRSPGKNLLVSPIAKLQKTSTKPAGPRESSKNQLTVSKGSLKLGNLKSPSESNLIELVMSHRTSTPQPSPSQVSDSVASSDGNQTDRADGSLMSDAISLDASHNSSAFSGVVPHITTTSSSKAKLTNRGSTKPVVTPRKSSIAADNKTKNVDTNPVSSNGTVKKLAAKRLSVATDSLPKSSATAVPRRASIAVNSSGHVTTPRERNLKSTKTEKVQKPATSLQKQTTTHQPDVVTTSLMEVVANQERECLETLCKSRTQELSRMKIDLDQKTRWFEALAVVVNYLVNKLDSDNSQRLLDELRELKEQLSCTNLQLDELTKQRDALINEIQNLKQHEEAEIDRLQRQFKDDMQRLEDKLKKDYETEMHRVLMAHSEEMNSIKESHDKQMESLKLDHERVMIEKDEEHCNRLSSINDENERNLIDLKKKHECQLEEITFRFEHIKVTLSEKVEILRSECEDLRRRENSFMESCQREAEQRIQNALAPYKLLPQEIESLKAVLDLRNQEIHDLRHHGLELQRELEELPSARDTIKRLQQKIENLEAIINIRTDYERQLTEKHQQLLRKYERESKANKRLSMDKEELMWRLSHGELSPDALRRSKLRSLENRLDKANLKCKEAEHIQKTYLQIKAKLEDEHKTFENTLDDMENDINRMKVQLKELKTMRDDAQIARDNAKAELEKQEKEIYADRRRRELEIQKVRKEAEEKRVQAQIIQRRIDARQSMTGDDLTMEQRQQLGAGEEEHERIRTYEEAFRVIKEATGVSDTQEVVLRFENQGDTQHHLEQLKSDNEKQIEHLKEERDTLQLEFQQMKYSGEASLSSGQRLLEDYQNQVTIEEDKKEVSQARLEKCSKILTDVKSGIEHLSEKLKTLKTTPSDTLKIKSSNSDEAVLDQMNLCEEKLLKLLEDLNKDLESHGRDINEVSKEMEEEEFHNTNDMKLPSYNTRVKLPALSKELIYDDEDQSGEDEDVMTRQGLKKQSQQIVDAKTRRRPGKRKKKVAK